MYKCIHGLIVIYLESEVRRMSDMKLYEGYYSYSGDFKQKNDGTSLLIVREFTYAGKYYRPREAINFII